MHLFQIKSFNLQSLSGFENEFDLHENESVSGKHFHMNGLPRTLLLKQRQKKLGNGPLRSKIYRVVH